jgi:hypothetical protein
MHSGKTKPEGRRIAGVRNVRTDVDRHNTVDVDERNVDATDIQAAYKDATGKTLGWTPWDWRIKF